MDPVTTAILAALAAGANSAAGDVAKAAIVDAYDALKTLLKSKFGHDNTVTQAVEALESKPDSAPRRAVLAEEITAANIAVDPDVVAAAQALLAQIKVSPGGEQHVQQVTGDFNALADRGSSASVTISGSVGKRE